MRSPHYKFFSNTADKQAASSPTHQKPRQTQAQNKFAVLHDLKLVGLQKGIGGTDKKTPAVLQELLRIYQCEACRLGEDDFLR